MGGCPFATLATSKLHHTVGCNITSGVVDDAATGVNAASAIAAGGFHPGVVAILVDWLQVKRSCLIDQVATDYIAYDMPCGACRS